MKALLLIATAVLLPHGLAAPATQALTVKSTTALEAGRFDEASLWWNTDLVGLVTPDQVPDLTPHQALAIMEAAQTGRSDAMVWYHTIYLARAAYAAGDLDKAKLYTEQALAGPPSGQALSRGREIYYGNQLLGRFLLKAGDTEGAKQRLAASGAGRGAPEINSWGPNMIFAREMLEAGQRDAVLSFLEQCRTFWKDDFGKLDVWETAIRDGKMPDFGDALRR
jgi:hypothetical protein